MITYYILSILSVLLYLYSFFPVAKINSSSTGDFSTYNDTNFNVTQLYEPTVDRLVLIVIDALRHDFVTAENMPYLFTMGKKHGCSAVVKVESPTVTLPRIKALTTGNVPQFIDVVLNLVRIDAVGDSFLHRAVEKGKRVVFYGDDTWLKVYPDLFARSEGTTSFYVNDFAEVDNNVTRNVRKELTENNWDIMVLHYLGLDHIGHVYGPYSSLVQPKLQEMDNVIKSIHQSTLDTGKTLIAVTGDHGMKDGGGHGGTTYSETHVPLVLSGINCTDDNIDQIDIPITFSALLGLRFPKRSIGKLPINLLKFLSKEKLLLLFYFNVLNLQDGNEDDRCAEFNKSISFHKHFLKTNAESSFIKSLDLYKLCSDKLNMKLVKKSVEQYDSGLLISCSVLFFCFTSSFLYIFTQSTYKIKFQDCAVIYFIILVAFTVNLNAFLAIVLCILIIGAILYQTVIGVKYLHLNIKAIITIFLLLNIIHGASMGSSSFIEEEHQTWYFYFSSFLIILLFKAIFDKTYKTFLSNLIIVLTFRILRKLNQTGDKWSHLPDIAQFLILEENFVYLCTYYSLSLMLIYYLCVKISKPQVKNYLLPPILFCIFILKFYLTDNANVGKLIWVLILLNFIRSARTKNCIENVIVTCILISTFLLRPHNVILPPFLVCASTIISKQIECKETFTVAHLWLGNALYFAQGHSNSLASVDVAAGFVSLNEYVPSIVTFQVLCHAYCLPILSHLLVLKRFNDPSSWNLFVLQRLWIVTVTFSISFALRHHLFVWSVFAPKLLIESSHCTILLVEILAYHFTLAVKRTFENKKGIKL